MESSLNLYIIVLITFSHFTEGRTKLTTFTPKILHKCTHLHRHIQTIYFSHMLLPFLGILLTCFSWWKQWLCFLRSSQSWMISPMARELWGPSPFSWQESAASFPEVQTLEDSYIIGKIATVIAVVHKVTLFLWSQWQT